MKKINLLYFSKEIFATASHGVKHVSTIFRSTGICFMCNKKYVYGAHSSNINVIFPLS